MGIIFDLRWPSMPLSSLFADFSALLHSPQFHERARHSDHVTAFRRRRKLPLPTLVAVMLCGMRKSVHAELDEFFGHLRQQASLAHEVSEQAFARARAKLANTALPYLNDWLLARAERDARVARWHGLRLVAADATTVRFGLRASHVPRAAAADQIAFGLYLPGAEMMLAASLHSVHESERQMLFEHLDRLSAQDLLLLDRGYPCRWLPALLTQRGISFCLRVEKAGNGGFACVREFLRSGLTEQVVQLRAPDHVDAVDYECDRQPTTVRLVRHVASTGKIRVLMTNLFDAARFPAAIIGDLYHQRWRIEEAFKRLKHRLALEHVSGLSQLAVAQDLAAKILCDNIHSLLSQAAHDAAQLPSELRINRTFAVTAVRPLLPLLLLGRATAQQLADALDLLARRTYVHRPAKTRPRPTRPKPHKFMAFKTC